MGKAVLYTALAQPLTDLISWLGRSIWLDASTCSNSKADISMSRAMPSKRLTNFVL